MGEQKKRGIDNAVEFLHRRYIGDDPERKASLEAERALADAEQKAYDAAGAGMRYVAKREEIEAWHWEGSLEGAPAWVIPAIQAWPERDSLREDVEAGDLVLVVRSGEPCDDVTLTATGYISRDAGGRLRGWYCDEFEARYMQKPNGDWPAERDAAWALYDSPRDQFEQAGMRFTAMRWREMRPPTEGTRRWTIWEEWADRHGIQACVAIAPPGVPQWRTTKGADWQDVKPDHWLAVDLETMSASMWDDETFRKRVRPVFNEAAVATIAQAPLTIDVFGEEVRQGLRDAAVKAIRGVRDSMLFGETAKHIADSLPYVQVGAKAHPPAEAARRAERMHEMMDARAKAAMTGYICFDPDEAYVKCVSRDGVYCGDVDGCPEQEPASWVHESMPIGYLVPRWVRRAFENWPKLYSLRVSDGGCLMFQSAAGAVPLPAGSRLRVMSDGSIRHWLPAEVADG